MSHTPPPLLTDDIGSPEKLSALLNTAIAAGAKSLLILSCDANGFTPQMLDGILKAIPVPVFGGIFPQIVAGTTVLERGSVVCGLPLTATVRHISKLSDPAEDYTAQTEKLVHDFPSGTTLVTLVDGLSTRISALLESLYEILGNEHQYIGGGAGSLSFTQKPCLFSNHGLLQDCAQITAIGLPIKIGIEHGWHTFAGPFLVTGSYDNTITTLDYLPAFQVYRKVVEADSGKRFDDTPFFDLAKAYPFGLDRFESKVVVRDPLFHTGDKLVCVGEVPANHLIYILKGDDEKLLAASRQCAQTVVQTGGLCGPALLFDCISRALFLQGRFQEEIGGIHGQLPDGIPLLGALSLGEIADSGNACLEFFNKTAVLGVFSQQEACT